MQKIVVVIEDEIEIAEAICAHLSKSGFVTLNYTTAESFYSDKAKPWTAVA